MMCSKLEDWLKNLMMELYEIDDPKTRSIKARALFLGIFSISEGYDMGYV